MDHNFWMSLASIVFNVIMSGFAAHYGAKNGVNAAQK